MKVGQGDPHTIPSSVSMRGIEFGDPRSVFSQHIERKAFFMMSDEYTNFTSVTLKADQGEPHTIPSSVSLRGTYTINLETQASLFPTY